MVRFLLSRHVVRVGVMTILLVGSAAIFRNVRRAHAQDRLVDGNTVVLQEVVTRADGTKQLAPTYEFATRSDGSSAFLFIRKAADAEAPVRLIQLRSGSSGYVSDSKRQKSIVTSKEPLAPKNIRTPASHCSLTQWGRESLSGQEQIAGYRAQKVVLGNMSSWYALDYGCALVKQHVDWTDGGKSDKYLVLLRPGDPDSNLFTVPAGYADVPQSTFAQP